VGVGVADTLAEGEGLAVADGRLAAWDAPPQAATATSTPARRAEVWILKGGMAYRVIWWD
jgi:hypothetical protein